LGSEGNERLVVLPAVVVCSARVEGAVRDRREVRVTFGSISEPGVTPITDSVANRGSGSF
jgi:hypothetical protein